VTSLISFVRVGVKTREVKVANLFGQPPLYVLF
jgi:hypothetical protein